jgi:hypothetical protein
VKAGEDVMKTTESGDAWRRTLWEWVEPAKCPVVLAMRALEE